MKKLIYSTFALAALVMASACDKQNTEPAEEPRLYVNTWVVNFNTTGDATKDDLLIFTLNADWTATVGEAYTQKDLDELRNNLDTEKLTEEQKSFVDGLKVNDVYTMDGWYSLKANADGSNVLCLVFDSLYGNDKTERQSISLSIKDITENHIRVFNYELDDKDNPLFCDAYSLATAPQKLGTFYDQWKFNGLPLKEPETM